MGLENAHFSVSIENQELTNTGQDKVKLFFCANKGGRLDSIEKVASGGEIARVSLAIKKLIAAHYKLPSLLLDEIDTGISGKVAHQMGEIMQEMAVDMQVLTITHNPQIAAKGLEHLKVYKKVEQEKTNTYIKNLSKEEKISEIAQLISGNTISESALAQAKELVNYIV
jgi:DNA repair protein RecN (Recombination protein N)